MTNIERIQKEGATLLLASGWAEDKIKDAIISSFHKLRGKSWSKNVLFGHIYTPFGRMCNRDVAISRKGATFVLTN